MVNKKILINNFATRCFRDIADKDYIHARLGFRAGLMPQFFWSSLQAIEKYLKCVLLLNRVKAKRIKHDLEKALNKLNEINKIKITFSDEVNKFIRFLDTYGRFRYLETHYYSKTIDIVLLDKSVWEIRRYCHVLDYKLKNTSGKQVDMLPYELERIKKSSTEPPINYRITGGFLEKVIEKETHPSREPLLWQNAFFGKRIRKNVSIPGRFEAVNSPLTLHPEILDDVLEYVFLPKDVIDAYKEELTRRST